MRKNQIIIISDISMEPNQPPKVNFKSQTQQNQTNSVPLQKPVKIQYQGQQNTNLQFQMPTQISQPQQQAFQQQPLFYQQQPMFNQQQQQPMFFQQQMFPQQQFNVFPHSMEQKVRSISLLKKREPGKKIAAIIVSFVNGCSYDQLFTSVEQQTVEGTQVLVYACTANSVDDIIKALKGEQCSQAAQELRDNIKEVHADCVVFNWECSGNYSGQTFTEGRATVMAFLKLILDKGHMAMFSDFSLKALIQQWDASLLGNNPFVRTGETSNQVQLRFKSAVLKECPSAQLQIVGEMADQGKVNLHTLGSTILYSVDPAKVDNNAYKLTVLTINTTNVPCSVQHTLTIDGHKGSAGHVLLTYKSGGHLLTSMGHWIELMKIDTSEKKLFQVAEKQYGKAYAEDMRVQYASMDVTSQKAYVKSQARTFVQNQAPCSNMNFK